MENATDEMMEKQQEPELKLPDWIKPDTKHGEKGKLLYIEEWGRKERRKQIIDFIISIGAFPVLGVMFILLGITIFIEGFHWYAFFCLGNGLFLLWFFNREFQPENANVPFHVPFSIYENGCTTTTPEHRFSYGNQETYIPWTKINEIDHNEEGDGDLRISMIDGTHQTIYFKNIGDLTEVYEKLRKAIPDKVGAIINDVFTYSLEDFEYKPSARKKKHFPVPQSLIILLGIYFISGIIVGKWVIGEVNPYADFKSRLMIACTIWFTFLAPLMVYSQWRGGQFWGIRYNSEISKNGIIFPLNRYGFHFRSFDIPLSLDKVRKMELFLSDSHSFKTRCTLTSGETLAFSPSMVQRLGKMEGFETKGWTVMNVAPSENRDRFITWNFKGIAYLCFLKLVAFFIGMITSFAWYLTI